MELIKDTVQSVIFSLERKKGLCDDKNPEELLKKLLTKKELQHIKFNYFRKGILGISVDSPVWLYKLSLHKEDLRDSLRKNISTLEDIRFRIGAVK